MEVKGCGEYFLTLGYFRFHIWFLKEKQDVFAWRQRHGRQRNLKGGVWTGGTPGKRGCLEKLCKNMGFSVTLKAVKESQLSIFHSSWYLNFTNLGRAEVEIWTSMPQWWAIVRVF